MGDSSKVLHRDQTTLRFPINSLAIIFRNQGYDYFNKFIWHGNRIGIASQIIIKRNGTLGMRSKRASPPMLL